MTAPKAGYDTAPPAIVVYHHDCVDGLASAWVLSRFVGDKVVYLPYGHHDTASAQRIIMDALRKNPGAALYFADVAPPPALMEKLVSPGSPASHVIIMDHHKSAAENLSGFPALRESIFSEPPVILKHIDPGHPSAAKLIWEHIFPDKKAPAFFEMIAKMDIGKDLKTEEDFAAAALIDSKDISSTEAAFRSFEELSTLDMTQMANLGRNILMDQRNRIARLGESMMYAEIRIEEDSTPLNIPIVNADVHHFARDISTYLLEKGVKSGTGIGMAWFVQGNGSVTVSIRTGGTPDASAVAGYICRTMDAKGGGHATSAAVHFASLEDFTRHIRLKPRPAPAPVKNRTPSAP